MLPISDIFHIDDLIQAYPFMELRSQAASPVIINFQIRQHEGRNVLTGDPDRRSVGGPPSDYFEMTKQSVRQLLLNHNGPLIHMSLKLLRQAKKGTLADWLQCAQIISRC